MLILINDTSGGNGIKVFEVFLHHPPKNKKNK